MLLTLLLSPGQKFLNYYHILHQVCIVPLTGLSCIVSVCSYGIDVGMINIKLRTIEL